MGQAIKRDDLKMLISEPNDKTRVPSFNIHNSACGTVRGCKIQGCLKYCYNNKSLRMYRHTREMYKRNLAITKKDGFINAICNELKDYPVRYFRIHVCGEFYNQAYYNKWVKICLLNPEIRFFTYTKNIDLDIRNKPDNLIIHLSDDNDKPEFKEHYKRFDGVCKIKDYSEDLHGFTGCMAQIKDSNCVRCKLCITKNTKIYFKKH